MPRLSTKLIMLGATLLCAACAPNGKAPALGLPTAADLGVGSLPPVGAIMPSANKVVGTPTEVYTRVARGVLTCWFGAAGPLKTTHIYHADAEPASKGGQAKIEIFQRDPAAPDPRGLRAYQISIAPSEGTTKLETENLKIPDPLASRLKEDVDRWGADEAGCGDQAVTGGWTAENNPPPAEQGQTKANAR